MWNGFRGRARRLDDIDLPAIGHRIGVGEDEIHAVLEVESRGSGFDRQERPALLFEPHLFWRELGDTPERREAARLGIAYPSWGMKPYPSDSYPRLAMAMAIDETAALRSASWGLGQILGSNFKAAGFTSPQAMVKAFMDDEEAHLSAMVNFIKTNRIDDDLRRHDWAGFARVYNGPQYAKHNYHGRLAAAYAKWSKIKDTPWTPGQSALETAMNDPAAAGVRFEPVSMSVSGPSRVVEKTDTRRPPIPILPPDVPTPEPSSPLQGFWARFAAALSRRLKG
jgi:hypothetical protein